MIKFFVIKIDHILGYVTRVWEAWVLGQVGTDHTPGQEQYDRSRAETLASDPGLGSH